MPVLSIADNTLSNFHQYIIKSIKPQLYEQSYDSLVYSPLIHIDGQFTDLSSHQLKSMSSSMVNNIFSNLNLYFPNFMVIYTDGSVCRLSAGYSFYIPDLHVSFANYLPPSLSSFTAESYAIYEALLFISNTVPRNYLIASDSMSCLQLLVSNPFNSKMSPLFFLLSHTLITSIILIDLFNFCGFLVTLAYMGIKWPTG